MTKHKKHEPTANDTNYKATEQEKTALRKQIDRLAAAPAAPRVKVEKKDGKTPRIAVDHPDKTIAYGLLMEALGTASYDFVFGLLSQLANAGSQRGEIDESGLNFMLSVIKDIKPRDQIEAMLAAQMAAVHMTTMTLVRRLVHVDNIPQQDSAGSLLTKLTRTYATQMETLKRYRTGGEQKVTVQHVSVNEGGQAIVGNVTQAPNGKTPTQATAVVPALTDARTTPMPLLDEKGIKLRRVCVERQNRWLTDSSATRRQCGPVSDAVRKREAVGPANHRPWPERKGAACTAARKAAVPLRATKMP